MANLDHLRASRRMEPNPLVLDLQKPDGAYARAVRRVAATWSKAAHKLDSIGKNPSPGWWRVEAVFGRR